MSISHNIYLVFVLILLTLNSSCTRPKKQPPTLTVNGQQLEVNGDTLYVYALQWQLLDFTDYPFTQDGDLACVNDAVEFHPNGFTETAVGTPLNQTAVQRQQQAGITPTVAYRIKTTAKLDQAISLGLKICALNEAFLQESRMK